MLRDLETRRPRKTWRRSRGGGKVTKDLRRLETCREDGRLWVVRQIERERGAFHNQDKANSQDGPTRARILEMRRMQISAQLREQDERTVGQAEPRPPAEE